MTLDIRLFYLLNNLVGKSRFFDVFVVFLSSYLQYFLITALFFFFYFSVYSRREKIYIFWTITVSTIVSRLGVTELIRFFYHRPRPFLAYQFRPLVVDNAWSFPSGHAAFFFALAAALYLYDKKWGVGFFIATLFITTGRVIAGVHYPSDILGGMIIGILTACLIFYSAKREAT